MSIDNILLSLGYKDHSKLYEPSTKKGPERLYTINGKKMIISIFVIEYENKKSYLNTEYEDILDSNSDTEIKNNILRLIDYIKYPGKGKVYDIGWDAHYFVDPREFTTQERCKIILSGFKDGEKFLKTGSGFFTPKPNDIVASKPSGIKIDKGFNTESEKEGTLQRASIYKKLYSYGDIKEDGMQYAMYDQDMNLIPI